MESTAQSQSADMRGMAGDAPASSREVFVERVIPFLVFSVSLGYLLAFIRYSSLEPDEGILLQGGQRILDGQIPYRDFFSFYTPGSFYLTALLFRIFGDSMGVARTALTLVA